jgi:hypothetical protein
MNILQLSDEPTCGMWRRRLQAGSDPRRRVLKQATGTALLVVLGLQMV